MSVPLTARWKFPVAYFLIVGMSGVERANLVHQCLCKLADIGVWIESITCDGPSCHVTMFKTLGATMKVPDLIPSFPHPSNSSHHVSVFYGHLSYAQTNEKHSCFKWYSPRQRRQPNQVGTHQRTQQTSGSGVF